MIAHIPAMFERGEALKQEEEPIKIFFVVLARKLVSNSFSLRDVLFEERSKQENNSRQQ